MSARFKIRIPNKPNVAKPIPLLPSAHRTIARRELERLPALQLPEQRILLRGTEPKPRWPRQLPSLGFVGPQLQKQPVFPEAERLDRRRRHADLALVREDLPRRQRRKRHRCPGVGCDAAVPPLRRRDPVLLPLAPPPFREVIALQSQEPEGRVPVVVPVLAALVAVAPVHPVFVAGFDSPVVLVLVLVGEG